MSTSTQKSDVFKFDDFISKIVTDPAKPAQHTVLTGFIGASSEKEHVRVYFDESLNNFIDVPEKAIVFTKALSNSPHGGSTIWVKADDEYVYGAPNAENRAKRKFFEGPVYQEYVTAYANSARQSISFQYCPTNNGCPSHIENCTISCPSNQYCTTHVIPQILQERQAPTVLCQPVNYSISFQYCPTNNGCPSHIENCTISCPSNQYCTTHVVPQILQERQAPTVLCQPVNYSISFQYCPTNNGCPSHIENCTISCPSNQYCTTHVVPQILQERQIATAGGYNQGFNPYRGY